MPVRDPRNPPGLREKESSASSDRNTGNEETLIRRELTGVVGIGRGGVALDERVALEVEDDELVLALGDEVDRSYEERRAVGRRSGDRVLEAQVGAGAAGEAFAQQAEIAVAKSRLMEWRKRTQREG